MYKLFSRLPTAFSRMKILGGTGVILDKLDHDLTGYQGQIEEGGFSKPPKYTDEQWQQMSTYQKYKAALRSIINAAYRAARFLLKKNCCESVTIRVILVKGAAGNFYKVTDFLDDVDLPYGNDISLGFEIKDKNNAIQIIKR